MGGLVEAAGHIVTALAAATGAIVAILGLKTWRRQLRGSVELEGARAALRAAYQMRDAIKSVRDPFHGIGEIAAATKDATVEGEEEFEHGLDVLARYEQSLYTRRWEQILEAGEALRIAEIEGEVLWGRAFVEALAPLTDSVKHLSTDLSEYFRYKGMEHRTAAEDAVMEECGRTVRAKVGKQAPDDFERGVDEAVTTLEAFLRPIIELKLRSA